LAEVEPQHLFFPYRRQSDDADAWYTFVFNYYKDNQILSTPIGANSQNTWTFFGD